MSAGRWIDRARPVRDGEELDAGRLAGWLAERLPALAGPVEVEQFPSGFSNLTYLVRAGERELVLRRPPFGAAVEGGHDMSREHRILAALEGFYPKAPAPLARCDDAGVLGAPFYLMERVRGVILRPRMPAEMRPAPATMAAIADGFVETLVELHAVDYRAAGLGGLGRPEGYVRRQIEGWRKRWARARTDDVPAMEQVGEWLAGDRPADGEPALIHNDFKYDNLVLDPDDWSRVKAVLDWEMATLGDPLLDLGTSLGYWLEAGDPPAMRALELSPTTLPGNPTRRELVERYSAASGREVPRPVFCYAYGLYKIAVIVQQIYARWRQGHTSDPRFAGLLEGVRACAGAAWQAIQKGRIDRLYDC